MVQELLISVLNKRNQVFIKIKCYLSKR